MTRTQTSGAAAAIREIREDFSLKLALGTGTLLTAFLATAHACCLGLAAPHPFAALLQICTVAG